MKPKKRQVTSRFPNLSGNGAFRHCTVSADRRGRDTLPKLVAEHMRCLGAFEYVADRAPDQLFEQPTKRPRNDSQQCNFSGPILPDSGRDDDAIVLFDGVCNLCNATVNFLIDHDPAGQFRFGALQADAVAPILKNYGLEVDDMESFVLIDEGRAYRRSEAALRIALRLGGVWRLLYPLILMPRPLRDALYAWVAANRYRWFGKQEVCRVPTPELKERFIG